MGGEVHFKCEQPILRNNYNKNDKNSYALGNILRTYEAKVNGLFLDPYSS